MSKTKLSSESNQIIEDFAYRINDSKGMILFLGAGFSQLVGICSYSELKQKMLEKTNDSSLKGFIQEDHLEILMGVLRGVGSNIYTVENNTLNSLFKSEFDAKTEHIYAAKNIFDNLINLPIKCIITTNYDNLIEKSLDNIKKNYTKTSKFADTAFSKYIDAEGDIPLFKIHGDVAENSFLDLVVGYKDNNVNINPGDRQAFINILSFLIAQYPILYLGYSFKDNFSNTLFKQVNNLTSKNNIFSILKDGDVNINKELICYIKSIKISDFNIELYEDITEKLFYEYYKNNTSHSIINFDLDRLEKKLMIDKADYLNNKQYPSGLFKTLGYVLYYQSHWDKLEETYQTFKKLGIIVNPVKFECIEFKYIVLYKLLYDFKTNNKKPEKIVSEIDEIINELNKLSDDFFFLYSIQLTELKNNLLYYKIVILLLSFENGSISTLPTNFETFFTEFQEPIDNLTRMKIFKYHSIYFRLINEPMKSIEKIKIAKFFSQNIDYKREILLISMNEEASYINLFNETNEIIILEKAITKLKSILDGFNQLNYREGIQYTYLYLYHATKLLLNLVSIDNHKIKTLNMSSKNFLDNLPYSSQNIKILYKKIREEK